MSNPLVDMAIKNLKEAVLKKLASIKDAGGHPLVQVIEQHVEEFEEHFRSVAGLISAEEAQMMLDFALAQINLKILHGKLSDSQVQSLRKTILSAVNIALLAEQAIVELAGQVKEEDTGKKAKK
jgi:hypothetical protein